MSKDTTRTIGHQGEYNASQFLQSHGLILIEQNYRCQLGEIDLIMQEKQRLVFVEVRLRHNPDYGHSIETISPYKKRKIIGTAKHYLLQHDLYDKIDCRFDVVGLEPDNQLIWIKNAFWVNY